MKRLLPLVFVATTAAPLSAAERGPGATAIGSRTAFFEAADLNDDGSLSRDEAAALALSARTLRALFRACDRNLDRVISLREFLAVPVKRMPIPIPGDPIVDPPPPPDSLAVTQFLGLPLDDAIALAVRDGRPWRVIIPGYFYTLEYIENRVNFRVTNGIVTDATRG